MICFFLQFQGLLEQVSSWWLLPVLLGVHVTVFSALLFFLSGTAPVREEQHRQECEALAALLEVRQQRDAAAAAPEPGADGIAKLPDDATILNWNQPKQNYYTTLGRI